MSGGSTSDGARGRALLLAINSLCELVADPTRLVAGSDKLVRIMARFQLNGGLSGDLVYDEAFNAQCRSTRAIDKVDEVVQREEWVLFSLWTTSYFVTSSSLTMNDQSMRELTHPHSINAQSALSTISKHLKQIHSLILTRLTAQFALDENDRDSDLIIRCEEMFQSLKRCIAILLRAL